MWNRTSLDQALQCSGSGCQPGAIVPSARCAQAPTDAPLHPDRAGAVASNTTRARGRTVDAAPSHVVDRVGWQGHRRRARASLGRRSAATNAGPWLGHDQWRHDADASVRPALRRRTGWRPTGWCPWCRCSGRRPERVDESGARPCGAVPAGRRRGSPVPSVTVEDPVPEAWVPIAVARSRPSSNEAAVSGKWPAT